MPWWVTACGLYCLVATAFEMWKARQHKRWLLLAAIMHAPLVV